MPFLLLCRHARHRAGQLVPDKDSGEYPTEVVARVLRETLNASNIDLRALLYAPSSEAKQTARLLVDGLQGIHRPRDAPGRDWRSRIRGVANNQPMVAELSGSDTFDVPRHDRAASTVTYAESTQLDPDVQRAQRNADEAARVIEKRLQEGGQVGVLVVGHQPALSWLSDHFTRARNPARVLWRWHASAVPVASAEVVCLEVTERGSPSDPARSTGRRRWQGRVVWTIHPDDRGALEQIQEKVRSKMESAKLLSGVITLALTALLGVLLDHRRWASLGTCAGLSEEEQKTQGCLDVAPFAVPQLAFSGQVAVGVVFGFLILAFALFLMAMYAYDSLLMPTRFWAESPSTSGRVPKRFHAVRRRRAWLPERPPSSSAWVAYRNMMRIWFMLFTPAVLFSGAAFILLAVTLLRPSLAGYLIFTVALGLLLVYRWWFKPATGSED